MKIAIKNPAPIGPNLEKWGDYHFGLALAKSLEKLGASVVQHFWPNWDDDDGEDLVILLRGKRSYTPPPSKLSLVWIISHPGTIKYDEISKFDMVYVASETHYKAIGTLSGLTVDVARQCTDTSVFYADGQDHLRRDMSFVANSRGVRREVLSWAVEAKSPVQVIGRHWNGLGLGHLVKSQYIDNDALPDFYRRTRLTLNDHWSDMAHFGYINNRIFDCLACGTPILTDEFPELRAVCGDGLLYASDAASFGKAIEEYLLAYPDVLGRAQDLWRRIGSNYSFDARAAQIWDWATTTHSLRSSLCYDESGTASPAIAPLTSVVGQAVALLREAGVKREVQTLHLCPSPWGTSSLFANKDISYLSGGFGRGPWHVLMDEQMGVIANKHFDMIVIEPTPNLADLVGQDQAGFAKRLASKLSKDGVVVAPSADAARLFGGWQGIRGDKTSPYAVLQPKAG